MGTTGMAMKALEALQNSPLDERVTTNPILGSPWVMVGGIILYLLTVKVWGPRFMANRKPYKVERIMMAYNIVQILLNLFIFYEAIRYSYWRSDFSLTCRHAPDDMSPENLKLARPIRLYLFSKYLDFLDTIFFLLRKKFNQITFLHIYHHSIMVFVVHNYAAHFYGSHATSTGILNSFVHFVMYLYYQVAAMKLNINLENWKRRMTQLQFLQFFLLFIHFTLPLFNNWCNANVMVLVFMCSQNMIVSLLFANFYYQTYIRKDRKKSQAQKIQ
ncbi:very long chain fatty acid elongase 7-like [Haematobia irritans]|uniref:very long chain fatty acid elongase 7-like n=1 Tax=Haematobia irritans TaxID=7368 RepID=UPI003F4FCD5B